MLACSSAYLEFELRVHAAARLLEFVAHVLQLFRLDQQHPELAVHFGGLLLLERDLQSGRKKKKDRKVRRSVKRRRKKLGKRRDICSRA